MLRHGGRDASTFAAKGLVLLEIEDYLGATTVLHEALAVSPQDPMATELLNRALEGVENVQSLAGADEAGLRRGEEKKTALMARAIQKSRRKQRQGGDIDASESMAWSTVDGTSLG